MILGDLQVFNMRIVRTLYLSNMDFHVISGLNRYTVMLDRYRLIGVGKDMTEYVFTSVRRVEVTGPNPRAVIDELCCG
jgi:hypothetical protein